MKMQKHRYRWVVICLFFCFSEVYSIPSDKVVWATHKILESIRVPHLSFSALSPEEPFGLRIKEGRFDCVGSVALEFLIGECFSQSEWTVFKDYFMRHFLNEHPNCIIQDLSQTCESQSTLISSVCALKGVSCKKQKYSLVSLTMMCTLPLDEVDLFSKKERFYQ